MSEHVRNLPYDPTKFKRETLPYYISMTDSEIAEILKILGLHSLDELFNHLPNNIKFQNDFNLGKALSYNDLIEYVTNIANKNKIMTSYIGDGLKNYKVEKIVDDVCSIRGLTTAYTPYQPERGQGTLWSLYLFSNAIHSLTGFEAVNASMYDRSTCLFEALNASTKLSKNKNTVLLLESNYPGDIEVVQTLRQHTSLNVILVPFNKSTGLTDLSVVKDYVEKYQADLASIAFPQVNSVGNIENFSGLTEICEEHKLISIAVIDPMLISTEGLLPPSQYGKKGTNFFVAEGQHLALAPNFGGPGLGIFGTRYNETEKLSIRATPGRYIGKTIDHDGNDAVTMILSTREQHIRRDKASSNICSNQAFVATLAGAALLSRGSHGITTSFKIARKNAENLYNLITSFEGFKPQFPNTPFVNEFCVSLPINAADFLKMASKDQLELGIDVSERLKAKNKNILLLSCSDIQTDEDYRKVESFLLKKFKKTSTSLIAPKIPEKYLRLDQVALPTLKREELFDFYQKLGEQNVSPDDNIYPLGSCTMKYNPLVNDYLAGLPGITNLHPQSNELNAQGSLQILYEIAHMFKQITGLAGVALQPVAGAQGELVGIKMFQAYHADHSKGQSRNIILIPKSAHGTNPATSTMAGFITKEINGSTQGIIEICANQQGQIDMNQLKEVVSKYHQQIAGIMVTNPNTSGIFETNFKEMADLIHSIGGLVYMDGANMNAIAGIVNLDKLGVDAVHNNLHKTWSIPHGGGGPGDAIVAVSKKLVDYIPGTQVKLSNGVYEIFHAPKSIGSFHRHHGNFAHKVRGYSYLLALGTEGVIKMSSIAVLSARYLFHRLGKAFPTLPENTQAIPRMHEFILTLTKEDFDRIQKIGIPRTNIIPQIGKLFLDFGVHAPTVAFPEAFGLMIEPTESFSKKELDRFCDIVLCIRKILDEYPHILITAPHFTPIKKVDEVKANKDIKLNINIDRLPPVLPNKITPHALDSMSINEIFERILKAHEEYK